MINGVRLVSMQQSNTPVVTMVTSTDGVEVATHDYGGSGPHVIFCHATGFHGRYWDPICTLLSDEFHCVSLDFRGHGDSSVPLDLSMDWNGMAWVGLNWSKNPMGFCMVPGLGYLCACHSCRHWSCPNLPMPNWLKNWLMLCLDAGFHPPVPESWFVTFASHWWCRH